MAGLSFAFDANAGETPQSIAQKRALIAQLMGSQSTPTTLGAGFSALGDGIVANVLGSRAKEAETAGQASANDTFGALTAMLTGQGGATPSSGFSGASVGAGGSNAYRDAIASIESAGSGDYGAIGPTNDKLGRALGKYQVMEANIGPWSKAALGREISPDEFLANPQLQDQIFDHQFGGYVDQFGPEGAAQAWFAGPGGVGKGDRRDALGTSVSAYTDKFTNALGAGGQPTQVASLDPSIGAPAQAQPQPQQVAQPAPMVAPAQQQAQPAPVQTAQGPSLQMLMEAAANPWLNESQKAIVNSMISQQMQTQQQANDPLRQLQIQAAQKSLGAQPKQWQKLDDHTLFDPVSGETKPVDGGGGSTQFEGTGLDAQAWNILQNSDPGSKEYATAYSIIAQPKPQMVQTENGMMLVPVAPQLPAWLVPPGGAAPGPAPAATQAAPDTLMPNDQQMPAQAPMAPQGQSQANPSIFGGAPAAMPPQQPAVPVGPAASPSQAGVGQLIPGTRKPSTEAQDRNSMLSTVLTSDLPTINANFDALGDPKGQMLGGLPMGIGNAWQSEEYQRAANAVSSSVSNILYAVSGASANPGELAKQVQNLTPQFGDKPGAIADKKRRLNTFVNAVASASGDPELIAKAREESLRGLSGDAEATRPDGSPPADVDPAMWAVMTPEERALWP